MLFARRAARPGRAVRAADAGAVRGNRRGLVCLTGGLAGALGVRVPVEGIIELGWVILRLALGLAVGTLAVPAMLNTGCRG
eukprot:11694864-Alexandrium_andersonii.AAC.1